ncbi:hypothetical protein H310_06306 [Aphanomyces invadans]|uniref:TAFII28-like protein domain-containing protein n=1 Tax=Aphanomyces invadans TaxID=157072 RepID=A0A024U5Z0_9STRA|nr:hypothetical protein H310_06306 [Aphanomyces invadans]ETW01689.1 hypothetical protein H310_06306 [Aphanomyces invadans]|eukprot:XP_008869537.1 hypothetical protein H310_06306 [Aphanomyces invadans]
MSNIDDELDEAMMEDENEGGMTQDDVEGDASNNDDVDKTQSTENSDEDNEANDGDGDIDEGDDTGDDNDDSVKDEDDDENNEETENLAKLKFIQSLPEGKMRQHEQYRRSHFDKMVVKRCMMQVIEESSGNDRKAPSVHMNLSIVMSGLAKKFVGELTEKARELMEKNGESGPIRPHHLREAHRKYYKAHPLARGRQRRRLLA